MASRGCNGEVMLLQIVPRGTIVSMITSVHAGCAVYRKLCLRQFVSGSTRVDGNLRGMKPVRGRLRGPEGRQRPASCSTSLRGFFARKFLLHGERSPRGRGWVWSVGGSGGGPPAAPRMPPLQEKRCGPFDGIRKEMKPSLRVTHRMSKNLA